MFVYVSFVCGVFCVVSISACAVFVYVCVVCISACVYVCVHICRCSVLGGEGVEAKETELEQHEARD